VGANEVTRFKPFCESLDHRPEQLACFVGTTLIAPQTRQTHCSPELPRQSLLLSSDFERLREQSVGRHGAARAVSSQQHLGLDAQNLRRTPMKPTGLNAGNGLGRRILSQVSAEKVNISNRVLQIIERKTAFNRGFTATCDA
jgi:hypothetical protein